MLGDAPQSARSRSSEKPHEDCLGLIVPGVGQENGLPVPLEACSKGGIAVSPGLGLDALAADRAALAIAPGRTRATMSRAPRRSQTSGPAIARHRALALGLSRDPHRWRRGPTTPRLEGSQQGGRVRSAGVGDGYSIARVSLRDENSRTADSIRSTPPENPGEPRRHSIVRSAIKNRRAPGGHILPRRAAPSMECLTSSLPSWRERRGCGSGPGGGGSGPGGGSGGCGSGPGGGSGNCLGSRRSGDDLFLGVLDDRHDEVRAAQDLDFVDLRDLADVDGVVGVELG